MLRNCQRPGVLWPLLLGTASLLVIGAGPASAGEIIRPATVKESAASEQALKANKTIKRRRLERDSS